MKVESRETVDLEHGIARNWRIGQVVIEWYVERPREEWLRFDSNLSIRWFADD